MNGVGALTQGFGCRAKRFRFGFGVLGLESSGSLS